MTAAGAVVYIAGLGAFRFFPGDGHNVMDMIPVDYVTNGLLVATCHSALSDKSLHIYNCASAVAHPINYKEFGDTMQIIARGIALNRRLYKDNMKVSWIKNEWNYNMLMYLTTKLPLQFLNTAAKMPLIGTPAVKKQAEKFSILAKRGEETLDLFSFFINGDWRYENRKLAKLTSMLDA